MNVIMSISWVVFFLWICFETSAVYEYLMMLPCLDRVSHIQKYKDIVYYVPKEKEFALRAVGGAFTLKLNGVVLGKVECSE